MFIVSPRGLFLLAVYNFASYHNHHQCKAYTQEIIPGGFIPSSTITLSSLDLSQMVPSAN
jgi:hypothetical protein